MLIGADPALDARIAAFMILIGVTAPPVSDPFYPSTFGLTADPDSFGEGHEVAGILFYILETGSAQEYRYALSCCSSIGFLGVPDDVGEIRVGHFLVRTVPEPSSAVLLAIGIGVLAGRSGSRRRTTRTVRGDDS